MYAHIQTTTHVPDLADLGPGLVQLADTVAGYPGFAGLYALQPIGATGRMLITLWDTATEATDASARARERFGPRPVAVDGDLVHEVRDDFPGLAADERPAVAVVASWPAPMSPELAEAGKRLRRERLAPVVLGVPGVVRMLAVFQVERAQAQLVTLYADGAAAAQARTAIDALALPGLADWRPDTVVTYRVVDIRSDRGGLPSSTPTMDMEIIVR